MKLIVTFTNSVGGVLDSRTVIARESRTQKLNTVEQEAADAAVEMIRSAGELHHGDKISITEA
jgi:hypothetical protein